MNSTDSQSRGVDALARVRRLALEGEGATPSRRLELEAALAELEEVLSDLPRREAEQRRDVETLDSAQTALQDQALRYRQLFDFAPDAYLVTDLVGVVQEANHTATQLFGYRKEFLVGKPLPFLVHPDDRRAFYTRLVMLQRSSDRPAAWEARVSSPGRQGPALTVALSATGHPDEQGRLVGFRWLIRDVTAQREAEEARRAALAFSESLLEAARVLVLVIDAGGRLLRTNTRLEEVTGYGREALAGAGWHDLLFQPEERTAFQASLAAGRNVHAIHVVRTSGGRRRPVDWYIRPLPDAPGGAGAVLAVGHDVTELEEAQRKGVQLERLAAIGQMAAGLAHESRNALQRGHACLERLHWKLAGQPDALELVERAQRAQDDLLRLYEDVREYAATVRIQPVPCDPAAVWREVWADLIALAPGRDARLEEQVPPYGERVCSADRFRLAQVFRNVLENALAACPDPVRVVIACRAAQLAGRAALRIGLHNNGPVFTEEQRRQLFEPFFTTKPKGTGLGLAIVKRIVEAHGGEVAVGEVAVGAEILITLPRSTP